MNPLHPLSIEAKIIEKKPFIFDERLSKTTGFEKLFW
jgi:hypothetical protein